VYALLARDHEIGATLREQPHGDDAGDLVQVALEPDRFGEPEPPPGALVTTR